VTGVALDVERLDLVVGGFTAKLTATVAPANADNPSVTWSSSDPAVATVSSAGLVTAVGSGTATITVTTVEGGFTDASAVTVHSDTVTSAALMYPVTGQIAVTWTDPVDLNATGIQVAMVGGAGSVSQVVQVGAKRAVFTGLTLGDSYSFSIRVLGASGTSSDQVTTSGAPEEVVKVLVSSWLQGGQPTILNDSYGTAATETHDLVDTRVDEIKTDSKYPMNYRWVLMPGLTMPADPSLVSLKGQEYKSPDGGPTKEWVATDRYVTIHAGAGWSNQSQWNSWTQEWGCISEMTTHLAYADTYDAGAVAATFRMSPSTEIDGGVRFEWVGKPQAYLVHTCLHAGARTAAEVGADFLKDSSWVLEDVTLEKYTAP